MLRAPLARMLIAGLVLYGVHALWHRSADEPLADPELIRIDADEVRALASVWKVKRGRPARRSEMEELLSSRIREEILSREAIAMGMDVNDPLIRRQLAQKVTFLVENITSLREPTDAEVAKFLEENATRFSKPGRVSFEHRYFNRERHGDDLVAHVAAVKKRLREQPAAAEEVGDPSMLPEGVGLESEADIARVFGPAFAAAVLNLKGDAWQGPVESTYGVHLVRVLAQEAGRLPPLAEIRAEVAAELRLKQQREASEQLFTRLRERYQVEVDRDAVEAVLNDDTETPR